MQLNQTQLWDFTFVSQIHKNIDLVRNNCTGQLMVRQLSPAESYPVFRAISSLNCPNIMAVYDTVVQNGICVSLCEYINGTTLAFNVERIGVYEVKAARNIMCMICDGLTSLHRVNIVHRDIKPENIMIDTNGVAKIIDYSITRHIKPGKKTDTYVLGTAGYASPEQFGFAQTSGKADIYACGVLLNFLLTGKLPNEELHTGVLRSVIERCIEIDEKKRFKSAGELKKVLQGRKINNHREFRPPPGFRGRHVFPKILTVMFYILWFGMLLVYINGFPMVSEWKLKYQIQQAILGADIMLFWSALPYVLFGDMFRLSEKINPDNPHNGKYVLKILGVASVVFGFVIMIIGLEVTKSM